MNVTVILEQRFVSTSDGNVWTDSPFALPFWKRYLSVYDSVSVVARMSRAAEVNETWQRVDGARVRVCPVPMYLGPREYLLQARAVQRAIKHCVRDDDAVIMRVPSQLASVAETFLSRAGHPYGVEVVGDPYDTFSPGSVRHLLRPFFRHWFARQLRRHCAQAVASAYVTEKALQLRYPPRAGSYSTHYSSIELGPSAFASQPLTFNDKEHLPRRLITVGTLAQLYKAPDILIDAVSQCVGNGLDLRLTIVGDGQYRRDLVKRAQDRGIAQRVQFVGHLPRGEPVHAALDRADLFVLPSRQEGLPRAMIEAMARALPCIGSNVGGIPELLLSEDVVPPGDATILAAKIHEVLTDLGRMARMSARNLAIAQEYREEVLHERRVAFYRHVEAATEAWLNSKRRGFQNGCNR